MSSAKVKSKTKLKNKKSYEKQDIFSYQKYTETDVQELLKELKTSEKGLSYTEAKKRLGIYGLNLPAKKETKSILREIGSKLVNPLILVLLFIIFFSLFFGEKISAIFISVMILVSVSLDFVQERKSDKAVEKLNALVRTHVSVIRDGNMRELDIKDIVPGDVIELYAGDMIPADIRLISSQDLFINQSSLTGESFPVEKISEPVYPKSAYITELINMVFMGSTVVSGSMMGLVVKTGVNTQFGEISKRISGSSTETSFDKGIRQFTMLMIKFIVVLVIAIFVIIFVFKHGSFEAALLFSLAVAVGLTPEMLPTIVTINLSKGAIAMSKKKAIVKKLDSIQNFGAMDVLCTDKTGTLTMDQIVLETHCDVEGLENQDVLKYGYIVSSYQTGLKNVLDKAILEHEKMIVEQYHKVDEMPFDFVRKVMSVVVTNNNETILICKGAPEEIYKKCTQYELNGKVYPLDNKNLIDLEQPYNKLSKDGFRVLAVAYKKVPNGSDCSITDEAGLILKGYLGFLDPAKPSTKEVLDVLKKRGVEVKILTGDNELVTQKICSDVSLKIKGTILGTEIDKMDEVALRTAVETTTIFARMAPLQKERVIKALRLNRHVVGYLGDGINDAPSLKAADVGISVNNAVDIAKESADIILLEKSLMVLHDGIDEGRKTFGNITKYIKMSASSNFGNMLSVTVATLFLPFLPMLPIQILLNNFLYDLSQITIPSDGVDPEFVEKPKPWNIDFIKHYMVYIGPISSIFDITTYVVMWYIFGGHTMTAEAQMLFHTGWFLESICSQTLVIYIIRTNKIPFLQSRPNKLLVFSTLLILLFAFYVPFSGLAVFFGLVAPPPLYFVILVAIILMYLSMVQVMKSHIIKKYGYY